MLLRLNDVISCLKMMSFCLFMYTIYKFMHYVFIYCCCCCCLLFLSFSIAQLIRRYLFLYIPPGFWPRLVARLIAFPKRTLPNYIKVSSTIYPPPPSPLLCCVSVQGNLDGKLEVWAEGIYYFWSEVSCSIYWMHHTLLCFIYCLFCSVPC